MKKRALGIVAASAFAIAAIGAPAAAVQPVYPGCTGDLVSAYATSAGGVGNNLGNPSDDIKFVNMICKLINGNGNPFPGA
jgi:hypothetical protein